MALQSMTYALLFVTWTLCCASFGDASSRNTWQSEEVAHDVSRSAYSRNLLAAPGFSYGEFDGYKKWDGICQQGDKIPQTPISLPENITKAAEASPSGKMTFNYANFTGASALNKNGVQVNSPMNNVLTAGKEEWMLLQYHFHTPSEHVINGRHADAEIHFVHQNVKTEKLAVVGVLLDTSNISSSALAQALARVPSVVGEESGPFNLAKDTFTSVLSPAGSSHKCKKTGNGKVAAVAYSGSLTTPPCTAGVQWYVLVDSAPVGADQVLAFQRLLTDDETLGQNRRPLQPLLNRPLTTKF